MHDFPVKKYSDWLRTIPFLLTFISLLCGFDILYRISMILGSKAQEYVHGIHDYLMMKAMKIAACKFDIGEIPELNFNLPIILVCNHQSMMDIPIIYSSFIKYKPRFISKIELSKWIPFVSVVLRNGGHALIDRRNKIQSMKQIKDLARRMQEHKFAVAIFPEGTRAKDGVLKSFKSAGISVLLKELGQAQVIPVLLDGTWKFTFYKLFPVPVVQVTLRCGEAKVYSEIDRDCVKHCEEQVKQMLLKLREK